MTNYGKQILEIINGSHNHLSAEEIFGIIKEQSPGVVMATVYNNLNSLVKEGMIEKIVTPGEPDRYDNVFHPHGHMLCDVCGELEDIFIDGVSDLINESTKGNYNSFSLIIHYTCDKCKNQ